jgi:hypothetical protein
MALISWGQNLGDWAISFSASVRYMGVNEEGAIYSLEPCQVGWLIQSLVCLDEPWRKRFLALAARRVVGQRWDGELPTYEELAGWLSADRRLRTDISRLLNTWVRT